MSNEHRFRMRHFVDPETGEENAQFQCPECGEWNFLINYDLIRVLSYRCKKCNFEENQSVDLARKDESH